MTPPHGSDVPPAKRRKLDKAPAGEAEGSDTTSTSLKRPVSPPTLRRSPATSSLLVHTPSWSFDDVPKQTATSPPTQPPTQSKQGTRVAANPAAQEQESDKSVENVAGVIASPFQLTRIRDLAPHQNVDTVGLEDILGDPMIRECWNFNFLFDIDFVMQQFDEDVRASIKVKIIHGFWRRDDERRIALLEKAERYPNMELMHAYLPDPFGTHHSKMIILFRHDDCAQVVVHTANMISQDWTNMTQAVWRSPLLTLRSTPTPTAEPTAIGSGNRFYLDLRRYLLSYEKRLQRLIDQLALYDFSEIRAAFLCSVPSRQVVSRAEPSLQTSFGWLGLQEILSNVPTQDRRHPKKPAHIVLQVSSIATLGAAQTWLSNFQSVLARSKSQKSLTQAKPKFNIIFPTPEEVRTSLDGYESGGSIHTKIQSAQQQKQLQYLHPLLCHWKSPTPARTSSATASKEAHRGPAAPHIKTYIRFSDDSHSRIDWALLTSANLSKQAWGDVVNKQGEVRIQSYETGVLVWPELFAVGESECDVSMVPVFGKDTPDAGDVSVEPLPRGDSEDVVGDEDDEETEDEETVSEEPEPVQDDDETEDESEPAQCAESGQSKDSDKVQVSAHAPSKKRIVVGLRMPYDLPLSSYSAEEAPWCATQQYTERDWKGRAWGGYQPHKP
ncbi:tyrosyl-DNA phosphodiesterase-domain-containing protein [Boeremia exigua]|uniref:tyrosyl-DNA phosphodiesterase-domain-containing protein n=1 Tax=Boeremia exigua TaxID=749465 RepID=UPI001E8D01D3|nr:tyrosyl-DNA phosphodiesterase-domain-containing protein [Boeremia exigua]KAH6612139.1 tyrosyl-DNA phosphodiesterase-domain-containing protein [Boeremia exigua]